MGAAACSFAPRLFSNPLLSGNSVSPKHQPHAGSLLLFFLATLSCCCAPAAGRRSRADTNRSGRGRSARTADGMCPGASHRERRSSESSENHWEQHGLGCLRARSWANVLTISRPTVVARRMCEPVGAPRAGTGSDIRHGWGVLRLLPVNLVRLLQLGLGDFERRAVAFDCAEEA